jgi:hypothetical protein
MGLKEFFKPTKLKIILFIIFLLVLPLFGRQNLRCEVCDTRLGECPPCTRTEFKFFGIPLLIRDVISPGVLSYPAFNSFNLPINIILIVLIAYTLACSIDKIVKK